MATDGVVLMSGRSLLTPSTIASTRRRVLAAGGSGRIGALVAANLCTHYDLVLFDRRPPVEHALPFVHADISQVDASAPHLAGIDTVLHLAADPRPTAPWESIFPNSVLGALNVLHPKTMLAPWHGATRAGWCGG